mmetsp:Transcript_32912/g.78095  ORF Transcript_32912/g.78095 Transcript_32912/m.78095 type:complete len:115 (-) Transcript_32912:262-606(-)
MNIAKSDAGEILSVYVQLLQKKENIRSGSVLFVPLLLLLGNALLLSILVIICIILLSCFSLVCRFSIICFFFLFKVTLPIFFITLFTLSFCCLIFVLAVVLNLALFLVGLFGFL